jgi:arylsulfatase A-like enzyme
MQLELLEHRNLLSGFQHELLLSVDGLHQADIADPSLQPYLPNIIGLQNTGVMYTNAYTTSPSDSFPGTLSYLTGAGPGTTGVYYDDSYSRTLLPPIDLGGGSTPGTETQYAENIDINQSLISGGGNFDASSIDPNQLPRDPNTGLPVYPNQFLQTNGTITTIFDVAHQAGLYTAFSDKHPAYQIAYGNDPNSINDFYGPEINSNGALLDPKTGTTVNADVLLATSLAQGFVPDVNPYTLVDASNDPVPNDPNLETLTNNPLLAEKYDDLKVQAIINEINGQASHSSPDITNPQVPAIFGMNFQAVSVAEKYYAGGIAQLQGGGTATSLVLENAIQHTDNSVGMMVSQLQSTGLWSSTEVILTAKHGQAPRVGVGGLMADSTLPNVLSQAGTPSAFAVQDDVSLIYLQDQTQTAQATQALMNFRDSATINVYYQGQLVVIPANQIINKILSGQALIDAGLGNPATDSTTPDIVVTLKPGFIWVGNPLHFTNKRAEHGGFSQDDTHIALIVSGGLDPKFQGTVVKKHVQTTQIAVTILESLGLDPTQLTGAAIEKTQVFPGLGLKKIKYSHDHHGKGDDDQSEQSDERLNATLFGANSKETDLKNPGKAAAEAGSLAIAGNHKSSNHSDPGLMLTKKTASSVPSLVRGRRERETGFASWASAVDSLFTGVGVRSL